MSTDYTKLGTELDLQEGTKWDLKNFKLLDTVRGTQSECVCASDKLLYTGSADGSISVCYPNGKTLKILSTTTILWCRMFAPFLIKYRRTCWL